METAAFSCRMCGERAIRPRETPPYDCPVCSEPKGMQPALMPVVDGKIASATKVVPGLSVEIEVTPWWWETGRHREPTGAAIAAALAADAAIAEVRARRQGLFLLVSVPQTESLTLAVARVRKQLARAVREAGEPHLPADMPRKHAADRRFEDA